MAIPESQLETWSHQGSIIQSSATYSTIKRALEAIDTKYAGKDFKVFLQGSYGNDTNIFAESDVDIVVRLDSIYHYDLSLLEPVDQAALQKAITPATYTYQEFKRGVIEALHRNFGSDVVPGAKAIKIKANGNRRNADVVIATEFQRYRKSSNGGGMQRDVGICFFTSAGTRISNYPEQHSENCTRKHQETGGWFKPTVRILKNIRGKLVDNGAIDQATAPSYFLEGLLYNVPKEKFGGSYEATMVASINWILEADRSRFVCPNWQYYLHGDSPAQWPAGNCDRFLNALTRLWKEW